MSQIKVLDNIYLQICSLYQFFSLFHRIIIIMIIIFFSIFWLPGYPLEDKKAIYFHLFSFIYMNNV